MSVEVIAMNAGDRKVISSGTKHRVIHGEDARIEISNNGDPGFKSYTGEVTYYCFSKPNIYRSPISVD